MKGKNKILILDFGSQYTQLIAKNIRKQNIYSFILPCSTSYSEIKVQLKKVAGIIFSGGPSSVYAKKKPKFAEEILKQELPILGICYGLHVLIDHFKGKIISATHSEYGKERIKIIRQASLLEGIKQNNQVWMSHGDEINQLPNQFIILARSANAIAAIKHKKKKIYGLQFHPEVSHSTQGKKIISNFLFKITKVKKSWSMGNFVEEKIATIQKRVSDKKVLLAVSGGVDSSVLALLLHKALGEQLTCVFVDNGLLRENEADQVIESYKQMGIPLKFIIAQKTFLRKLRFIKNPERKRKIIGKVFLKIFLKIFKSYDFLAQGTLYPDVIESMKVFGPSDVIKTHHNQVKGIVKLKQQKKMLEPFAFLFKDEVREMGKLLKLNRTFIEKKPFPGPGLAIRILGRVTPHRLSLIRKADQILKQEIEKLPDYKKLWQAFPVLLPIKSVGVVGDKRVYGYTLALRLVSSQNGMTADFEILNKKILEKIVNRLIGEIESICRVVLDITSKPPSTIEWE